jgi:hypothetical protein
MAPILQYLLPVIGVCRNFPRQIVHAPLRNMGLNIQCLYTVQEITRLLDMVSQTTNNTTTGSLYRTSLELMIIETGVGTDLLNLNFNTLSKICMASLLKSLWKFLFDADIQIHHDIMLQLP